MVKRIGTLVVALILGGGVAAIGFKQIRPKEIYPAAKNPEEFKQLMTGFNQPPSFDAPRAQLNPKAFEGDKGERDLQVEEERKRIAEQDKAGLKSVVEKLTKAPELVDPRNKIPEKNSVATEQRP